MIIAPVEHGGPTESAYAEELLIKEAHLGARRRRWTFGFLLLLALAVGVTIITTTVFTSAPSKTTPSVSAASFIKLMRGGADKAYVATYQVKDYDFFSSGSIVVANIPSAPGAKAIPNVDGYSSTLRSAYVYRGTDGRIVQWIQNGTNVSACVNVPSSTGYKDLQCSRPSPFIQSNGFAEEGVGLVPANILQSVESFSSTWLSKSSSIYFKESDRFGRLQCLLQTELNGGMHQTTCLDHDGFVVSSVLRNGRSPGAQVKLTTLRHNPAGKDLKTLVKPTVAFFLPPV
jgi:hypothetical protein